MQHRTIAIFTGIESWMLQCNMRTRFLRARSLWRGSDALQGEVTQFSRTKGRACLSHLGDARGQQPQGGYFWRLDHVADGRRREDVGDPLCRRTGRNRRRVQHHLPAAGACRRHRLPAIPISSASAEPRSLSMSRSGCCARVRASGSRSPTPSSPFVAVHENGRPRELAFPGVKGAPAPRNSRRVIRHQERGAV
jgi:hypothetical protein